MQAQHHGSCYLSPVEGIGGGFAGSALHIQALRPSALTLTLSQRERGSVGG